MTTLTEAASTLLRSPGTSTPAYSAANQSNPAGLCIIHRGAPAAAAPAPKTFSFFDRSRTALSQLNEGTPSRQLHPGDVLYWIGCVGAVGLLLLVAIR